MNLKKYLEQIQEDESIFPIDSFEKKKKKNVLRVVYPEQSNLSGENKRVMIDFDGVINSYKHGWMDGKLVDEPNLDTKEAIDELHNKGYEIVIFTTRASTSNNVDPPASRLVEDLKNYLQTYNIYYDFITAEKLPAVAYIDDRAIRFKNWKQVLEDFRKIED
jgi:hypothetical protein